MSECTHFPSKKLTDALVRRSLVRGGMGDTFFCALAEGILTDPQGHVDALVEAGILECVAGWESDLGPMRYVVVQPHKHEFWATQTHERFGIEVRCECGYGYWTSAKLPIEVRK